MTAISTADHHHHHHDNDGIDVFGFWIYIMTDCILFATLFAAYAVLESGTASGPALKQLISLPYVLGETMFLLASSFTFGLAMLGFYRKSKPLALLWLLVTFIFGFSFVFMEVREFIHLYTDGHSWHVSAALSAFFTLVGTHGTHVSIGLIWMALMIFQIAKYGTSSAINRRLTYLGLFWHFLDIVWIFVFTIVYLMGAI
ncbi:MAG: cytochrome o ubiquinol oxidase subunit III [Gammaproteobacteria bacterium RIFCSPHIGHO2_02_FULL_39_13]|nr:MAG: cytochrome o ubiquinol oxidase subunit III [Gammaproteobacteria bacterium RIFCSPHIGHO2_02_FULL_39_13]OGT48260.1 MAG: cytochrome o ubiquinol oxidase subunit III [Gammaproteobacteria bacterium RIFCSPHIGHO2_12_FULL_39_24]